MLYLTVLLFLLCAYVCFIRRRFIKSSPIFVFLRTPGMTLLLSLFLSCAVEGVYFFKYRSFILENDLLMNVLFISLTITLLVILLTEWAVRGIILGTYLTVINRKVFIHINKGFIPQGIDREKYKTRIDSFINPLVNVPKPFPSTVVLKSHLITPLARKIIEKSLSNNGVRFTCNERPTPWFEVLALNLNYGGKTRYRMYSFKKHANGFKVHRTGHKFVIHLHP